MIVIVITVESVPTGSSHPVLPLSANQEDLSPHIIISPNYPMDSPDNLIIIIIVIIIIIIIIIIITILFIDYRKETGGMNRFALGPRRVHISTASIHLGL